MPSIPPRVRPALAWTALILLLCWFPDSRTQLEKSEGSGYWIPHGYNLSHFGILAVCSVLWMRVGPRSGRAMRVVAGGIALAALTELVQGLPMIGRDADWLDGLSDSLGVVAGVGATLAGLPGGR